MSPCLFYAYVWFFFAREKNIDCYEERRLKQPFSLLFWRKEAHLCLKVNFKTN